MQRDPALFAYNSLVVEGLRRATVSRLSHPMRGRNARATLPACVVESSTTGLWSDHYQRQSKKPIALSAGRLWDESKRADVAAIGVRGLPLELRLIGPTGALGGACSVLPSGPTFAILAPCAWQIVRSEMASAQFYLATSTYEPFGLAALEAAFCGCALMANDIPTFRELWGDAALFYHRDDPPEPARAPIGLPCRPGPLRRLGVAARQRALDQFTAERMADDYLALYQEVLGLAGSPSYVCTTGR